MIVRIYGWHTKRVIFSHYMYIGSVVFLRKFNDFASRRGHVLKWCTVRSYESVANALICAKGAMPVSRGLPLIVVYALYYAILLYGRWVFDVLTEICARVRPHIERRTSYLYITCVKIRDRSYMHTCIGEYISIS